MANELALLESQLMPMAPMFSQLLRATGVPAERIIRTVLISCERSPKLLECTRLSIIQAATTGAVLGLEADGHSGQGFLVPFRQHGTLKAQWITGYRGFGTIGARAGLTITGEVVRDGDDFRYRLGTDAFVEHTPTLGRESDRRILAAWASACAPGRAPIITIMSVDEIEEIRRKVPGASKPDSPWNQPGIPYAAMAAKTARRRLARSLPLSLFVHAARIDEAHEEQGKHAYIHPDKGIVLDGAIEVGSDSRLTHVQPQPDAEPSVPPRAVFPITKFSGAVTNAATIVEWVGKMKMAIQGMTPERAAEFMELNASTVDDLRPDFPAEIADLYATLYARTGRKQ